ncbi:MAG: hypothetical protein ABI824_14425 [Acidobacteriota bacterium]
MTTNPNNAILLVMLGALSIYLEFCRPGWVVPGVAGGVVGMVGLASLVRWLRAGQPEQISWPLMATMVIAFLAISIWLARAAIRARTNKMPDKVVMTQTRS